MISIHAPRTGSDVSHPFLFISDDNFNPRSPHGERLLGSISVVIAWVFQSTLPARGATAVAHRLGHSSPISIHAPRTGSDRRAAAARTAAHINFNPRSPHGERRRRFISSRRTRQISIHAPRTGSDLDLLVAHAVNCRFQSTLPARGATAASQAAQNQYLVFQSTLPARGATRKTQQSAIVNCISIHAPRTGSDFSRFVCTPQPSISIHAPRTGSDFPLPPSIQPEIHFNPRSPHGERLAGTASRGFPAPISIHAPRTGSDFPRRRGKGSRADFNPRSPHGERPALACFNCFHFDFNPRSPHGERQATGFVKGYTEQFQSTLPARGATCAAACGSSRRKISIHAPRTGSDTFSRFVCTPQPSISIHAPRTGSDAIVTPAAAAQYQFQSTLPARGATGGALIDSRPAAISIHAPRTGSDGIICPLCGSGFQSTLPARGATLARNCPLAISPNFNPRSPHGERLIEGRRAFFGE